MSAGLDDGVALNLREKELHCLKTLINHGVRFLLVGGWAVRFHGYLRPTNDVDVLVSNDGANAERLCSSLIGLIGTYPKLRRDAIEGRKLQINLSSHGFKVEILTAADGVPFDEAYGRRCEMCCPSFLVPVISKPDLLLMKASAGRQQDLEDVEKLGLGGV